MKNKILGMILCICILLSAALPAHAAREEEQTCSATLAITNLESFLSFAQNCRLDSYSMDLKVDLETDIDLTDTEFNSIPIFCGIFDGNGHTIMGLELTAEGSVQGLFRYLTADAKVCDLRVEGTVHPGGSGNEAGGIAGRNEGSITSCSFSGTVCGNDYVGGLVGVNTVTGILEDCIMYGEVTGSHFAGGIAGDNSGVIRSCTNEAKINETARENSVELADITLSTITNSEAINTVTDIGGIAGSSIGVIRNCVNRGDVGYQHMGYNIGGIAGSQSGAVLDCENYGKIRGRKEVGGIVGQLEPTALITYEEDALQILQRQLDGLGSTVSKTVSNIKGTGEKIVDKVGNLQSHVWNAREAVNSLIPDREDPTLPDVDSIQAAQNTISTSFSGMTETLQGMSATAHNSLGTMSTNLYDLQNQINAMRTTLGNMSETLGGSLTDVSDNDTEENVTGKISGSVNYGSVLADRNAGGIAGAIAMENDLDMEDDWSVMGENSLNFASELRAVILDCRNTAQITCKKQNAGGITGWQSMGLVKACQNSGKLDAESAEYVGGIAGQSIGYIRECYAKGELSGAEYVGGIAGAAAVATDCRSMVVLKTGTEKTGMILGYQTDNTAEVEAPVAGNLYFPAQGDIGGVDGISYTGKAEPMEKETFLALEDLPSMFRNVTIRFLFEDETTRSYTVPVGGEFAVSRIPDIPKKNGYVASWEGVTEEVLTNILFDQTFEAKYTGQTLVLQNETEEGALPKLLVQGVFSQDAALALTAADVKLPLENGEEQVEAWNFTVTGAESLSNARIRLEEGLDADAVRVMVCGEEDYWRECEHSVDGRYLVLSLEEGDHILALVRTPEFPWIIAAASVGVILLMVLFLVSRKKQTKK